MDHRVHPLVGSGGCRMQGGQRGSGWAALRVRAPPMRPSHAPLPCAPPMRLRAPLNLPIPHRTPPLRRRHAFVPVKRARSVPGGAPLDPSRIRQFGLVLSRCGRREGGRGSSSSSRGRARTHTHTHTHSHARTHALTRTHTHARTTPLSNSAAASSSTPSPTRATAPARSSLRLRAGSAGMPTPAH